MEGAILRGKEGLSVSIQECKIDRGGNLHHGSLPTYTRDFPDLFVLLMVTAISPDPGGRSGISEVDGSDPPFLVPRSGTVGLRNLHSRGHPLGGSLPSHQSLAGRSLSRLGVWRCRVPLAIRLDRVLGGHDTGRRFV